MQQNEFNGGVARYNAKVVISEYWVVFFAIKSVRVARFTDLGLTSFAVSDVTLANGVIPA